MIDVKGQVNFLQVDKADYLDEHGEKYTFENNSNIYYARFSIRPALVHNKYLKKVEAIVRYSVADLAKEALWGGYYFRTDIGLSYWFSLRTGLRIAYESGHHKDGITEDAILIRFVTGF